MIETRTIKARGSIDGSSWEQEVFHSYMKYIRDLSAFGWKIQSDNHVNGDYYRTSGFVFLLVRDTNMPNYNRINELEKEYENARSQLKHYNELNIHLAVFLFFIFIIPGIVYVVLKNKEKKAKYDYNEPFQNKMRKAIIEANSLL